jgi:FtsZ-binding cell division protein ZapB
VELEGVREHNTSLQQQVAEQQTNITALTAERDKLKQELKTQTKLYIL